MGDWHVSDKGEGVAKCNLMFDFPIDTKEIVKGIGDILFFDEYDLVDKVMLEEDGCWEDILDDKNDLWVKITMVGILVKKEEITVENMGLVQATKMVDRE